MLDGSEDGRELRVGVQDVEVASEPGDAIARPPWAGVLGRLGALRRAR